MSSPIILSTSPANGATGVVLGSNISITFDQAVDPETVTSGTFALMGPGQTAVIQPDGLIEEDPQVYTGREYIPGTFSFPSPSQVVFTPQRPLRPGVTYTLLISGADNALAINVVRNPGGEPLANTTMYQFVTGTLNLIAPPAQSPTASQSIPLLPSDILVLPRRVINNDLTQTISLYFPANIDPTSVDTAYSNPTVNADVFGSQFFGDGTEIAISTQTPWDDIIVSLDPIVGDPSVPIPEGLTFTVAVVGNQLQVTVGNWPTPPPAPPPAPTAPPYPWDWEWPVDYDELPPPAYPGGPASLYPFD